MKRALLAVTVVILTVLPSFACAENVGAGMMGATDRAMDNPNPSPWRTTPQHQLVMAYHKSVMVFARALENVARQGDTVPPDFARTVIAEMRRSTDEMEKYRAGAMASMPAGMRTPQMQKMMDEHLVAVKTNLRALEDLARQNTIPSGEVLKDLQGINLGCDGMSRGMMHRRGMGGGGMFGPGPGCGCQGMAAGSGCAPCGCEGRMGPMQGMGPMAEHRQMMVRMTQKLKAEDADMLKRVEALKRAPKDKKISLLSDIVSRMVHQRAAMTREMEKMQKNTMSPMPPMMQGQQGTPATPEQSADGEADDMDME